MSHLEEEITGVESNSGGGSFHTESEKIGSAPAVAPGFLGSTSYSAVFTEGENNIHIASQADPRNKPSHVTETANEFELNSLKVRKGAQILALLGELGQHQQAINRCFELALLCYCSPFGHFRLDIAALSDYIRRSSSDTGLLRMSRRIFSCTSISIDATHIIHGSQVSDMFIGDDLRWEVVGLMLTAAGLGAISLDEIAVAEEDEEGNRDWKELAKVWLKAGNKCKLFCQDLGQLNDLGLWLIFLSHALHTQVYGDAGTAFKP